MSEFLPSDEPNVAPSEKGVSRKDFLILAALAAGGAAAAKHKFTKHEESDPINIAGSKSRAERPKEAISELVENEKGAELLLLIEDITKYRKECGLSTDTTSLIKTITEIMPFDTWEESGEFVFQNNLPENLQDSGEYLKNIIETTLGNNGLKLIRGIKKADENDYLFEGLSEEEKSRILVAFHRGLTRFVLITDEYDPHTAGNFLDISMHEGIGHGTDPFQHKDETYAVTQFIYPKEAYLKVMRAKYMMLSKAHSIEGAFFNNPGDTTLTFVKLEIGKTILNEFEASSRKSYGINKLLGDEAFEAFMESLKEIGRSQGRTLDNMEFNEGTYHLVGSKLLETQKKYGNQLKGELLANYEGALESAYIEIYAEMMKYAIIDREHFGNDETIMRGAQEVVSAIREDDVTIEDIGKDLKKIRMQV